MYYARTKESRTLITPHQAKRWITYECPVCKGETYLRSGSKLQYFAHATGVGTEKCELYHPSTGYQTFNAPTYLAKSYGHYEYGPQLPTLVLTYDEEDNFELAIKLPALASTGHWPGKIGLYTKRGQILFCENSLLTTRFAAPIQPFHDQYQFEKIGQIPNSIWQFFEAGLNGLDTNDKTIFTDSEIGGRMLQDTEVLFRDECYWAIIPPSVNLPELSQNIKKYIYEMPKTLDGWKVFHIKVPPHSLLENYENEFNNWILRDIGERQAVVYFEENLPIRVEKDGTYIFPIETRNISVASLKSNITFSIEHTLSSEPDCYDKPSNGTSFCLSLEHEPDGDICIFADAVPRVWISFEPIGWFEPDDIRLSSADATESLISAESFFEQLGNHSPTPISFILPHASLKALIKVNARELGDNTDVSSIYTSSSDNFSLEAGNFGRFIKLRPKTVNIPTGLNHNITSMVQWLISASTLSIKEHAVYFPCQNHSWWSLMPDEVVKLRRLKWPLRYQPHLLQLKHALSEIYEN